MNLKYLYITELRLAEEFLNTISSLRLGLRLLATYDDLDGIIWYVEPMATLDVPINRNWKSVARHFLSDTFDKVYP